jgi:hypothetical protein
MDAAPWFDATAFAIAFNLVLFCKILGMSIGALIAIFKRGA